MYKTFKILILTAILFLAPNYTFPQDSTDIFDLSLEELLSLEVSVASKKKQKVNEAPSIISVISKVDIEKTGAYTVIDLLNYIPGVETSMDILGEYRLSIRGERKEGNILVLINGSPLNNFYDGKSIFDFPVEYIERVEVIRGPGSALYGTNALAGVINIVTVTNEISFGAKAGTLNSYSGFLNFGLKNDNASFNINGLYRQSDGTQTSAYTESTSIPYQDYNKILTNNWLKDVNLISNFNFKDLYFSATGIMRQHGTWIGPAYQISPDSEMDLQNYTANLYYNIEVNDRMQIVPKIYFSSIFHDYLMQERPDGYTIFNNVYTDGALVNEKYDGMLLGGEAQFNYEISEQLYLISGILYENMSLNNYSLTRNYYLISKDYLGTFTNMADSTTEILYEQNGKTRNIQAGYFQFDYKRQKYSIIAGLRFDRYSDFGHAFNPRMGIIYNLTEKLNIKILYGQAFRAPTFKELYDQTSVMDKDGFKGNLNLTPEIIHSNEIGLEYSNKNILARLNGFYLIKRNIIEIYDPEGGGKAGIYQNVGNVQSFGGELETTIFLSSKFNFFANTSYFFNSFSWDENNMNLKINDINFINSSKGDSKLKNIPQLRANIGINYSFYKFNIFAGGSYGSSATANDRSESEALKYVDIQPYLIGNFCVIYKPTPKVSIKIAGSNIGKMKYTDPEASTNIFQAGRYGMAQPDDLYTLSISFTF